MRTVARRVGTTCLQVDCNSRTGESGGQLRHGSPSLLFPLACQRLRGRFRARCTVGGYRIGAALCQPPRSDQFPLPLRGYEVLRVPLLPGTDSVTLFDMVNTVPAPYTNMHVVALRQFCLLLAQKPSMPAMPIQAMFGTYDQTWRNISSHRQGVPW